MYVYLYPLCTFLFKLTQSQEEWQIASKCTTARGNIDVSITDNEKCRGRMKAWVWDEKSIYFILKSQKKRKALPKTKLVTRTCGNKESFVCIIKFREIHLTLSWSFKNTATHKLYFIV